MSMTRSQAVSKLRLIRDYRAELITIDMMVGFAKSNGNVFYNELIRAETARARQNAVWKQLEVGLSDSSTYWCVQILEDAQEVMNNPFV